MANRIGEKIKLTSIDELLCVPEIVGTVELELGLITEFANHPFRVVDDEKMDELVESIRQQGILSPVLVRPLENGRYEMISGHRRLHAAGILGLKKIPAIVKEMTDDEAIIVMVDANVQREEILPSERAWSLKMKMDAMNRQGKRCDTTLGHDVPKWSHEIIGSDSGFSGRQVKRYIRLTELIPELLDMVDSKRLQFTAGVEISYIDKEIQQWICEYIHENGNVKQNQIVILRQELLNGAITQSQLIDILNENAIGRIPKKKVTLSEKKLSQYFPPHYTSAEMEKVIVELLTNWKEQGGAENGF